MLNTALPVILISLIAAHSGKSTPAEKPVTVLSAQKLSLEDRQPDKYVNDVFKYNILLNYAYLSGKAEKGKLFAQSDLESLPEYQFKLEPGKTFAFHDDILPEYQGKVEKTTNSHFNSSEGFESDGYLVGDGVCHFASLFYWAAKDAGLATNKPVPHDFAVIPEVPREYGVSIYSTPDNTVVGQAQNLYITNNKSKPVVFSLNYDGKNLTISVSEQTKEEKPSMLAMLISSEK